MKIGMSLLNFRPGDIGGTETYLKQLIQYLPTDLSGDLVFLTNSAHASYLPPNTPRINIGWSMPRTVAARIGEAFTPYRAGHLSRIIDKAGIDVMFYPQQSIFPLNNSAPTLMTVADLQHLTYPQYFPLFDRAFRATAYVKSLAKATHIIAISHFVKRTLIEQLQVAPDKITVVHHGYHPIAPELRSIPQNLPQPFIYYPAATFPHKGHARLFKSFAKLITQGKISHTLILSGKKTKHWQTLNKLIQQLNLTDHIRHLGFIDYTEVTALYQQADAIVFPTEYEGFGIPVLEAYQFHKKVICSQLPVFDEMGVPQSWQIDFSQPEALLEAIKRDNITQLERPPQTWQDCTRQTAQVLETLGHKA